MNADHIQPKSPPHSLQSTPILSHLPLYHLPFSKADSTICMHMDVRLSTHWNLSNLLAVNSQEK